MVDHRRALGDFIASAQELTVEAWASPAAAGKWSPAQVAEHLRLTYATLRAELAGRGGFRVRAKWWQRPLLRLMYFPRSFRTGRFPAGAPATREVRRATDRSTAARSSKGSSPKRAVPAGGRLDFHRRPHPSVFGKIALDESLQLATHHIRHHHRQILPTPEAHA